MMSVLSTIMQQHMHAKRVRKETIHSFFLSLKPTMRRQPRGSRRASLRAFL